jgi:hypothetical protein
MINAAVSVGPVKAVALYRDRPRRQRSHLPVCKYYGLMADRTGRWSEG